MLAASGIAFAVRGFVNLSAHQWQLTRDSRQLFEDRENVRRVLFDNRGSTVDRGNVDSRTLEGTLIIPQS